MSTQAIPASAGVNVQAIAAAAMKSSTMTNAAAEATETAAVTQSEASKGDQQAIRKLASMATQAVQPRVSPEGVGKIVDVTA